MSASELKLVLVLSCSSGSAASKHVEGLIQAAIRRGNSIKVYLIDEGVSWAGMPQIEEWSTFGVRLFGCALGARLRDVPLSDKITWGGLGLLSDLIAEDSRVLSL